mmetsp:Transcript_16584/g.53239  ORF Transcript_16584/g.53239 Transcript_16584/m.53239 type:complete len:202 (-) Transcript_16584:20-625(-)
MSSSATQKGRRVSAAGRSGGCPSRWSSPAGHRCCCSMSPPPDSTRSPRWPSSASSAPCPSRWRWWPPSTSRPPQPSTCLIGCSCCTAAPSATRGRFRTPSSSRSAGSPPPALRARRSTTRLTSSLRCSQGAPRRFAPTTCASLLPASQPERRSRPSHSTGPRTRPRCGPRCARSSCATRGLFGASPSSQSCGSCRRPSSGW